MGGQLAGWVPSKGDRGLLEFELDLRPGPSLLCSAAEIWHRCDWEYGLATRGETGLVANEERRDFQGW